MIERMTIRCEEPDCQETISFIPGKPESWNQYWMVFRVSSGGTERHLCPKHAPLAREYMKTGMIEFAYPGQALLRKDSSKNG